MLMDCNVTGTDTGTPSNPKFALKGLWEDCLLPQLDALVADNGPCAGAVVCHQEDNAGPHKEGNFHSWLEAEFKKRNWQLKLQAPQGPYIHECTRLTTFSSNVKETLYFTTALQ